MKHLSAILLLVFSFTTDALGFGAPDASFNATGKVNAGFGRGNDGIEKAALCADGSVIALGRAGNGPSYSYALAKFTPQGAPDNSFGTGGVVYLNLSSFGIPSLSSDAVGLAVTPDCSAYVAGGHGPDMSVGKYGPNGALVQVYDGGQTGFLLNGVPHALAIQPDGSILVAGNQGSDYGKYAVYRYLPGGALDINFGNGGRSYVEMGWKGQPTTIRVESDGRFIVTGGIIPNGSPTPALSQSLIARYNFNGSLDSSFNGSGVHISPVRNGRSEVFESSVTLADGRVMAAGTSSPPDGFPAKKYVFVRFMQNGVPDKFFGVRGFIVSSLTTGDNQYSFGYQNDGSIFVGEYSKIYKFDPNGSLDTAYGAQGTVTLNYNSGVTSLAAQSSGKLVAAGGLWIGTPAGSGGGLDRDFLALRLNSDGSPDNSFDGDGVATRDVGDFVSIINGLALQTDGKIVVAGGFSSFPNGASQLYGTGVSRYNPDGTLDRSFANEGKLYFNDTTAINFVLGVAVQPDGKIVVAGNLGITGSSSHGIRVVRVNGDGSPDNTFGSGGVFTYLQYNINAFDIKVQPDGKVVLGGFSQGDFMVVRLTTSGMLDQEFGGTGIVTTDINGYEAATVLAIQPNGKILLGGTSGPTNNDFAIVRYNANGALDQTFGRRGKVVTDVGSYTDDLRSIALTPNGYIVASGTRRTQTTSNFVVVQYTGKGLLNNSFANGGIYVTPSLDTGSGYMTSTQVTSGGSVITVLGATPNVQILKLTPAGAPDVTWAPGGLLNTGIYGGGWYAPDCLLDGEGRIVISGNGNGASGFIARYASTP